MENIQDNGYATALKVLGGIIIGLGILGSFFLGDAFKIQHGITYISYEYNYYLMFVGVFSSVITGTLIMGIGELIGIAHEMSINTWRILEQVKTGTTNDSNIEDEELPEL